MHIASRHIDLFRFITKCGADNKETGEDNMNPAGMNISQDILPRWWINAGTQSTTLELH